MKRTATPEQRAIVMNESRLLIVKALAGTGKTTTLTGYAAARRKARILYLAYNKSMQAAAMGKFPPNVDCKTTHSLAYRDFGRPYNEASKLGNVRPSDVMMAFGFNAMTAKHVLETVNNFIYSADREICADHGPPTAAPSKRAEYAQHARDLWEAMHAMPGQHKHADKIKMPHDGYLKLFQLSGPDLSSRYDIVLLDESQDTNPVTADIVLNQRCIRVLVGDSHQSIYGFRKATDALESAATLPGAQVLHLTHSFRFGPDVATLASALLAGYKGEQMGLIGRGPVKTIGTTIDPSRQYTTLCRTNGTVFAEAVQMLGVKRVHFVGGVENYPFERLVDIQNLADGKLNQVRDPFFRTMGSIYKLQDYANNANDVELGSLLAIQKEYGQQIPELVARIQQEAVPTPDGADALLSTAHRSKGLEFAQVRLADDFEDFVNEDGEPVALDTQELVEELNLLYVAVTRATHALQINSSVREAMSALGKTPGFALPDGVGASEFVNALLAGADAPRQEALFTAPETGARPEGVAPAPATPQVANVPPAAVQLAARPPAAPPAADPQAAKVDKPWKNRAWQRAA